MIAFTLASSFARPKIAAWARPAALPLQPVFRARPTNHPRRAIVRMLGPFFPNLGDSKLMKSEIVRQEYETLERDYTTLAALGTRFETFDREGKLIFIDQAMDVVDRFSVFLTRLKLSEEFSTQMFIKQYQVRLKEFGFTIDSLIQSTRQSLELMRKETEGKQ